MKRGNGTEFPVQKRNGMAKNKWEMGNSKWNKWATVNQQMRDTSFEQNKSEK